MAANATLVITLIGDDRPGLVGRVSSIVQAHGGNWVDSRMAHLAGQFAGIVRLEVSEERAEALRDALGDLGSEGLAVSVAVELGDAQREGVGDSVTADLEVVGQDRPGIVAEVSRVLGELGVNVEELRTGCESAAWSGEALFRATARLSVSSRTGLDVVREALEAIASDLMVDVSLVEGDRGGS